MRVKKAKEVLVAARWMLENVGWCQGDFAKSGSKRVWVGRYTTLESAVRDAHVSTVDCFCSLGAINAVDANLATKASAEHKLISAIGEQVTTWNDGEGRTKEEVLAAFDKAIKKASK